MGRPTAHYLSTLRSPFSHAASSSSTSRRSRSSSPPRRRSSSSSSPSPRKPRPSNTSILHLGSLAMSPSSIASEEDASGPRGWTDEWFLTKQEWESHPLNRERSRRSSRRSTQRATGAWAEISSLSDSEEEQAPVVVNEQGRARSSRSIFRESFLALMEGERAGVEAREGETETETAERGLEEELTRMGRSISSRDRNIFVNVWSSAMQGSFESPSSSPSLTHTYNEPQAHPHLQS